MRKIILTAFCLLLVSGAFAQSYSLASGSIERNPADMALASSAVASDRDISFAALRNAAVLPFSECKADVSAAYAPWAPSSDGYKFINLGVGFNFKQRWGFSVAGSYGIGPSYDVIDDYGCSQGTFGTSSMLLAVGVGCKITDYLSLGADFKYASEKLSAEDGTKGAFNADVFILGRVAGVNITAGVSTLGPRIIASSGESFSLPASAMLGVYYPWKIAPTHILSISADGNYYFKGGANAAAGVQYCWNDLLSVRAGYHFGSDKAPVGSYASVGLGVRIVKGLHLDAAYLLGNATLKNTFSAGLGYRF